MDERDKEIKRLNQVLHGGRPHDVISLEAQNISNEKLISHLNLQASKAVIQDIYHCLSMHMKYFWDMRSGLELGYSGIKTSACLLPTVLPVNCWHLLCVTQIEHLQEANMTLEQKIEGLQQKKKDASTEVANLSLKNLELCEELTHIDNLAKRMEMDKERVLETADMELQETKVRI